MRGSSSKGLVVYVNVYDLTPNNNYLHPIGFGAYHTGVEINGTEYTFAGGAGIFSMPPRDAPGAVYRQSIEMGSIDSPAVLSRAIEAIKHEFGADDYNLLTRNCNHFTSKLVKELLGKDIPGYLNRLSFFGSFFSCFMPQDMTQAPVNDANGTGTREYIGGRGGGAQASSSNYTAFGGTGQTLATANGGGKGKGGGGGGGAPESEQEKQERIRQARLARIGGGA